MQTLWMPLPPERNLINQLLHLTNGKEMRVEEAILLLSKMEIFLIIVQLIFLQ